MIFSLSQAQDQELVFTNRQYWYHGSESIAEWQLKSPPSYLLLSIKNLNRLYTAIVNWLDRRSCRACKYVQPVVGYIATVGVTSPIKFWKL